MSLLPYRSGAVLAARSPRARRRGRLGLPRWLYAGGIGYHVYANTGAGDPINYNTPVATVTAPGWTSGALSFPGGWKFAVRAFDSCGEEQNLDCAVEIVLDASGNDITNRPLAPVGLRAFALAGGSVRVEWAFPAVQPGKLPTGFHVYTGTGGVPNYTLAAATVGYSSAIAGSFVANLAGLTDGTVYTIGVRAFNAAAEEPNTITVNVTADATGPSPVVSLTAAATV
jgi:hypothetical protein